MVPVAPVGSALVLSFIAVFVAAALTAWIATSLDAPIGAFAPSIALFIVVGAMGGGAWVSPTALYALAALGYLLALAQHDLVARRTWFHAARPRGSRIAAGGAVVGAVAIVVALAVGPSVPGAGGSPLLDYKGGFGSSDNSLLSAPPPILHIQDKLTLGKPRELFTVRSDRAAYWRVIALDWFTNDNAWGVNKATEHSASVLTRPDDLPTSIALHQQFSIKEIDPHWLPAAYRPVEINLNAARVVPDSLTLLVDSSQPIGNVVYDVDSYIPVPSPEDLATAPSDPNTMREDLELPSDFPQSVINLAQQVTEGQDGPYGKALALTRILPQDRRLHLHDRHQPRRLDQRDRAVPPRAHEGFCEQFAATFAAMARSHRRAGACRGRLPTGHLGNRRPLPRHQSQRGTRGRKCGSPARAGSRSSPRPRSASRRSASGPVDRSRRRRPRPRRRPPPVPRPLPERRSQPFSRHFRGARSTCCRRSRRRVIAARWAPRLWSGWSRWSRPRSSRWCCSASPRSRFGDAAIAAATTGIFANACSGAWAEALEVLRAAGVPMRPSATALEFALRHAPAHGAGDAGPALMELARLQSAAMFAPDPPTDDEASAAWEQVDVIRASSRRTVTRAARWRRRLRPD